MRNLALIFEWLYAQSLKLYPSRFQAKFGDEMKVVFTQAARENSPIPFYLQELKDFPGSLISQHWYAWTHKEAVMLTNYKRPDWYFYPSWILLTTLSIPFAFFLDLIILKVITQFVGDFIYVDGVRHITEDYLSGYTFGPTVGFLTGILQYGLLRRYLPRIGWWVLATFGSWVIGMFLILIPGRLKIWSIESFDLDLAFLIMGFSIGIGQWLLLRRHFSQSGWWIGANVIGWGLLSLLTTGNSIDQYGLLALGFFPACATAMVFVLLMKLTHPTELQDR